MSNKSKITFVVTESMQKEMREKVVTDGYGAKEKSKWVGEAIEQLLNITDYPEYVNLNQQMSGLKKIETIIIEPEVNNKLDNAILKIKEIFPRFDGVQSCVVRTAIVQRLLRGYKHL